MDKRPRTPQRHHRLVMSPKKRRSSWALPCSRWRSPRPGAPRFRYTKTTVGSLHPVAEWKTPENPSPLLCTMLAALQMQILPNYDRPHQANKARQMNELHPFNSPGPSKNTYRTPRQVRWLRVPSFGESRAGALVLVIGRLVICAMGLGRGGRTLCEAWSYWGCQSGFEGMCNPSDIHQQSSK